MRYRVEARTAGLRLDRCLHVIAPALSRSFWSRVAKAGLVQVNDGPGRASKAVEAGDTVSFRLADLGRPELLLDPSEVGEPLYRDDELVAYSKPAGLLTHPAGRVVLRSAWILGELALGESLYPVHRLDKYTSGLLLFARSPASARAVGERLEARRVQKTYLALTTTPPPDDHFVVDLPLAQTGEEHVKLKMLPSPEGKPARTEFTVRERHPAGCLIEARPLTGRQHQIRAHLLAAGSPIVGDLLYGPGENHAHFDELDELKHATPDGLWHGLHAWKLEVADWDAGRGLALEAPLGGEFLRTLETWRGGG